jgi:Zn-dependent metalloprotease
MSSNESACRDGYVCSILPDYILQHVVDNKDAHPDARKSAEQTLAHTAHIRARRRNFSVRPVPHRGPAAPMHSIIPPHVFQAVIDSADASTDDKTLAQQNLTSSNDIRATRDAASTPTEPTHREHINRSIYDSQDSNSLPGTPIRQEGDPTIEDTNGDEVYDFFKNTLDFYFQVFQRDSIDDQGLPLIGSIHFSRDPPAGFDNAFWDTTQMIFGDGDNQMFGSFTQSLDVIAHELTHGVTQYTAALPYHKQAGALNESMSDVFGSMVKQFTRGQTVDQADWLIGAELLMPEIVKAGSRAIRDMRNPGTAYKNTPFGSDPQPAHMRDYVVLADDTNPHHDSGGVHVNSGICNKAFYLVATALGGKSWERAGMIWYASLLDPKLADFAQDPKNYDSCFAVFADLTVQHALALFGNGVGDVVQKAWVDVGVLT